MSDLAIPWLLLGDTRRRALAQRIERATEDWRRDWLPGHTQPIGVAIEDVLSRPTDIRTPEAICFQVLIGGEVSLVLVVPRRSLASLVGAPSHGADSSHRLADDTSLAAALEREALRRLAAVLLKDSAAGACELQKLTQGAVDVLREYSKARFICACITADDARCVLDVLIAPTVVERFLPKRPSAPDAERVERRRLAVGAETVHLDGLLGFAEVSVSELTALSPGDVIVLDQTLADAGGVAIHGGERFSAAAPGHVDGKRAIQIRGRAA
jgi:hypothetical protein